MRQIVLDHWLVKPMQGQGGLGIKRYHPKDPADQLFIGKNIRQAHNIPCCFWLMGNMCKSLVLIRNGLLRLSENQEFIFSGIINIVLC